jgi:rod shape-determining protein MreD
MTRRQTSRLSLFWAISLSTFVALVLTVLPVPQIIFHFWPDWIALVLIYWALTVPEKIGPWVGFAVGTLMEVLFVRSFGVMGLGLATLVFTVNRANLQLRVLSIWQQMIVVGLFIGIFKLITGWLYGLIDGFVMSNEYFHSLIGCMVIWPFIFILLQEMRRMARIS